MPIQTAYSDIARLVVRFKGLSAAARRGYNEDNTRKDFILPLFRALEWDTHSSAEMSAVELLVTVDGILTSRAFRL